MHAARGYVSLADQQWESVDVAWIATLALHDLSSVTLLLKLDAKLLVHAGHCLARHRVNGSTLRDILHDNRCTDRVNVEVGSLRDRSVRIFLADLDSVRDFFEDVVAGGRVRRSRVDRGGEGAAHCLVLGNVSVLNQSVDVSDFDVELIGAESLAAEDLEAGSVELWIESAFAFSDQVNDLGALTCFAFHECGAGVVVAHAIDVLLRDWEGVQVLGCALPRFFSAVTNLTVHLFAKPVKLLGVRRRRVSPRTEESVQEATFLRVCAQVFDFLHAQTLLLFPVVIHLG